MNGMCHLQIMPDCSSFLLMCWWQGKKVDCSELFQVRFCVQIPFGLGCVEVELSKCFTKPFIQVRKTNDGFCCSFNALKQSENVDL